MPLITLFQFVTDVALFHISYSTVQNCALGFLLLLYIVQGLEFAAQSKKQQKAEQTI